MTAGKEATPQNARDTERLHAYWAHGEGAAKIAWGTPGDFDRCTAELGKYITDPEGYCQKMHISVLGYSTAEHAKMDRARKSARDPKSHMH